MKGRSLLIRKTDNTVVTAMAVSLSLCVMCAGAGACTVQCWPKRSILCPGLAKSSM